MERASLDHLVIPTTESEKLLLVLDLIRRCGWKLGEFLLALFAPPPVKGKGATGRLPEHSLRVQKFLNGEARVGVGAILRAWTEHRDSRGKGEAGVLSLERPYDEGSRSACAALNAYAVWVVVREMEKEMRAVTASDAGLHVLEPARAGEPQKLWVKWEDFGENTVNDVSTIMQKFQPLTWTLWMHIATPKKGEEGKTSDREKRPPAIVLTHALSSIIFCRNRYAKRLAMFEGILHFSCGAQRNIFDYGSRVGRLPSYSSILDSLSTLADSEEEKLKAIGRDPTKALIWVGDNVQTGHKKREARFGRHSTMEVGTAATAIVARDFTPALHNTASHIKPIQEEFNMRQNLDVNRLRSLLDYEHIRTVGSLQFVRVLVNYIPQLKPLKSGVAVRYRQDTAKVPPPENWKTELYPLGTTNKNEANTGELKDAVVDFLEQMGMDEESVDAQPQKRILFGGDGLTYEKLLQMKKFLQLHSTEYQRLDIIQPFLQLWHTEWHDLCRIYETHLGETGNKDPSTLGHNSNVISQPLPSNPKKVDYYPAAHTTYTILDARILDCWRTFFGANNIFEYFNSLPDEGLPTIDDLVQKAEILFDVYCTPKSHDYYMTGGSGGREPGSSGWSVPHGTHWDKPNEIPEEPVKSKGPGKRRQKMREKGKENVDAKPLDNKLMKEEEPPFDGDASLGRSIMFMYDNIISREVAYAVAEGDAGRVYEGIKHMLFTFAGSGHTKYVTYLLEMISYLEYRISPALKEFFLKNWLVNPSGEPNGWQEQDLLQEHFNRDLEADVKRKDKDFGDKFLRSVVSRTVQHCSRVKKEMRSGLELAKKGNRHIPPHSRPEILTLLRLYKEEELHSFRKGRRYPSGLCLNAFREGTTVLGEKVEKWCAESYRSWVSAQNPTTNQTLDDTDGEGLEDREWGETPVLGRGGRSFVEGELFFFEDNEEE